MVPRSKSVEYGASPAGKVFSGQKFSATCTTPWKAVSTIEVRSRAVIIACRSALLVKMPALKFIQSTMIVEPSTVIVLKSGFCL